MDAASRSNLICYLLELLFAHSKTFRNLLWSNCFNRMMSLMLRLLWVLWSETQWPYPSSTSQDLRLWDSSNPSVYSIINEINAWIATFKEMRSISIILCVTTVHLICGRKSLSMHAFTRSNQTILLLQCWDQL